MAISNRTAVAILIASLLFPIFSDAKPIKDKKLLFVFGDSLFDPGNNQYLKSNSSHVGGSSAYPYGMSLHNHSTGRISDGLIVPDFIALFANLSLPLPFMKPGVKFSDGASFASGGAAVLEKKNDNGVINFRTQISDFKKVMKSYVGEVGEIEARKIAMRSVFLFSIGGNDYFGFNPNATQAQRAAYVNMVIGNLTNGIKELYDIGLRKIAIQNVGPLGCYPGTRSRYPQLVNGACFESLQAHAAYHNKVLSQTLKKMQTRLPGFKYSIFDYFHALAARIHNPKRYGFKVGLSACCGSGLYNGAGWCGDGQYNLCTDPNEYVLFDGAHHTQRTNKQLAQLLWNGKPKMTGPYNVKQLFQFP